MADLDYTLDLLRKQKDAAPPSPPASDKPDFPVKIDGGGSVTSSSTPTEIGGVRGTVKNKSFNADGRVGLRLPLGDSGYTVGAGATGHYARTTTRADDALRQAGLPAKVRRTEAMLAGLDASLETPGGQKITVELGQPVDKNKSVMLRFKSPF
ncbi:MAG: hypothetical protein KIT36_16210 [Alphaproteobacteria bacterium]|nr:hypothetical protein [Alphaproteobacteria bacterium]